jgi:hypothetical protein
MPRFIASLFLAIGTTAFAQTSSVDANLLSKTRALYDAPFRRGLISFDCAITFDAKQNVINNLGSVPPGASHIVEALQPLKYRVFADLKGAVVSAQPKLPDLSGIPNAEVVEESNRNLIQFALGNWVPYAGGEVLPLGPTKYHFDKSETGYRLSMMADGLDSTLDLNTDLKITSMTVRQPMSIVGTTNFTEGPNGFTLESATVNANNTGLVRYKYTYQTVDGYQLPASISVASPQNQTLQYGLSDCKTQHGTVINLGPPSRD